MKDTIKEAILSRSKEYFEKDDYHGYVCPVCGSGTGPHGTGITTKDGIHFTCWAGCFRWADIFEIVGLEQGLDTFPEQLNYLKDYFNL